MMGGTQDEENAEYYKMGVQAERERTEEILDDAESFASRAVSLVIDWIRKRVLESGD